MAITAKTLVSTVVPTMLNSVLRTSGFEDQFYVHNAANAIRGTSTLTPWLYATASGTSIALAGPVVISVSAGSTGTDGVVKIGFVRISTGVDDPIYVYTVTISPAEEFTYAGTITITSATISISTTMA